MFTFRASSDFSKLLKGSLIAATFAAAGMAPLHAVAGPLDGVDILNLSGVTESGLSDGNMTQARTELTGAGATVHDVSIGSFSAASLVGIDILYVGLTQSGFTASQIAVIDAYVAGAVAWWPWAPSAPAASAHRGNSCRTRWA